MSENVGTRADTDPPDRKEFHQVDVMKALMIALVILDHVLPTIAKELLLIQFWERLSVPVFLVITGFNYSHSAKHHDLWSFGDLYSREYLSRKLGRYGVPFLILFAPLTLLVLILEPIGLNPFSSFAIFPFWGPGTWYIPVVFTSVIVIPLIYWLYRRWPHATVAMCFISDTVMHIILYNLVGSLTGNQLAVDLALFSFQSNIIMFLSAIALGFWISDDSSLFSKKNWIIWVLLPFSLLYLALYEFLGWQPYFVMGDYNMFMFPYAAFVFLVSLKIIPMKPEGKIGSGFKQIGRATYHILLTQATMFSILYKIFPGLMDGEVIFEPSVYLLLYLCTLSISVFLGTAWYIEENRRNKEASEE